MATAKTYTVNDLLDSVKARGTIPTTTGNISDADMLRFANEEIDENLGPIILGMREEFYLTYEDITLVAGQKEYSIPYRAYGSKIRVIKPIQSNVEGYPLVQIPIDQTSLYTNTQYNIPVRGFYLKNDKFVLVTDPSGLGTSTLRVYFYLRPNNMVELSKGSKITAIDTATKTVTVETIPNSVRDADELDFIQSLPNHKIHDYDFVPSVVNTTTKQIVFSDDLPTELQVGDYICAAGETVVPQVPADVLPLLEQSVTCKVLEAVGDTEGLQNALLRLQKIEKNVYQLIDSRVEAPPRKIVNTTSFVRRRNRGSGNSF